MGKGSGAYAEVKGSTSNATLKAGMPSEEYCKGCEQRGGPDRLWVQNDPLGLCGSGQGREEKAKVGGVGMGVERRAWGTDGGQEGPSVGGGRA